jgi:YHS domain-containing protein
LELTVPNLSLEGKRFRFTTSVGPADHAVEMPAKVTDDEERALYLTPGGAYTREDIAANGGRTATEKFKGFRAQHDLHPKAGDLLCPITRTKANPQCAWVVGGKTYQFCCPPCVDEFVKQAKEKPETILPPEGYVQK